MIYKYLNRFTIIWRWRIIAIIVITLFYLSYKFNFSKTIELISECRELQSDLPVSVKNADVKNTRQPSKNTGQTSAIFLPSLLNRLCNKYDLEIMEFGQTTSASEEQHNMESDKIIIRGLYINTLKFLQEIETSQNGICIGSVHWELVEDHFAQSHSLLTTIYIKHLRNETNS